MEPIEENNIIELQPIEDKGESLTLQITRVLVVNLIGFAATKLADRAFDKIVAARHKPLAEIKELNA